MLLDDSLELDEEPVLSELEEVSALLKQDEDSTSLELEHTSVLEDDDSSWLLDECFSLFEDELSCVELEDLTDVPIFWGLAKLEESSSLHAAKKQNAAM